MPAFSQVPYAYMQQCLWAGYNLDFQSTADQSMVKCYQGTECTVRHIVARHRSGAGSVSCLGGVYDASSKGGNAIVSAVQSWVTLASGVIVMPTLAALSATTLITSQNLFLSLTTGSIGAVRADVLVFGVDVT